MPIEDILRFLRQGSELILHPSVREMLEVADPQIVIEVLSNGWLRVHLGLARIPGDRYVDAVMMRYLCHDSAGSVLDMRDYWDESASRANLLEFVSPEELRSVETRFFIGLEPS